ncbi:ATP synthase B/B' CF family protein [Neorickettsia helminthoeca str. Oregon]|uniref:ATP synthase B/B' CF family protein n=1 Tax=Neorickettsia helminthoeca str. Oregon TaxID=1286528 RepID=X5HJQ9_9RICK|nr:hypothetical protein [Neorickettsia helminthoeca]AHX11329.1 ATP synthase B/B' CF family protein [Neorickettsia helminthoeca str. Oregon]
MPQFDISTYFGQIFWFFISFFLLYFFVRFVFLPKLSVSLGTRAAFLGENKRLLEDINSDLVRFKEKRDAALSDARFAAENILKDASIAISQLEKSANEKLSAIVADLREENVALINNFLADNADVLEQLFFELSLDCYVVVYGRFMPQSADTDSLRHRVSSDFTSIFEKFRKCQSRV